MPNTHRWDARAFDLLKDFVTLRTCVHCGSPTVEGYACTFCGSHNPTGTPEERARYTAYIREHKEGK